MTNMEYLHGVLFDREQDSVDVRLSTVQSLTHFNRRVTILWGQGATGRERG